ncbi:MAG TPA: selenide, water dikinase SelD, partial [Gemmatimonadota bacterium]|nr:selenide, water dikinase SelD [Gemmatimonadota bacterium]
AERALISTVDFFTPIVDDPYTFGAITAANALSDIYAMGGVPLFALNIVAFPAGELDTAILVDILRGGRDKAAEAGVAIIGGHSIDDREPKYGLAVVGSAAPRGIFRKSDGRAGDRLVLSKAVGTGIIATAIKNQAAPPEAEEAAVASMVRLNARALELARECDIGAITDVTGFGLVGHLHELARLSGLAAQLESATVPILPHARELAVAGAVPGGTHRNLAYVDPWVSWSDGVDEASRLLLCDAQTSGGLLITVAPADSDALVDSLRADRHAAAEIGRLVEGPAGAIEVR